MIEVDVQTKIVKAVIAGGGAAHKLSNRFLIGVSDLLIKQPSRPALLMEVKLAKFSASIRPDHQFKLDVSHLQKDFLRQYHRAGMAAGVISAVLRGSRLWLAYFRLDHMDATGYTAMVEQHQIDGFDQDAIYTTLEQFRS